MRASLSDEIRYWELRRILYNAILAAVFVGWIVLTWPHFREASPLQGLLFLLIYAAAANLCYTAAYFVAIPLQHSPIRALWQRWRWGLWLIGILIALLVTNYWIADEVYPYVR
jgi:hypothetical protein